MLIGQKYRRAGKLSLPKVLKESFGVTHLEYITWEINWYPRSLSLKFNKELNLFGRYIRIFYIGDTQGHTLLVPDMDTFGCS